MQQLLTLKAPGDQKMPPDLFLLAYAGAHCLPCPTTPTSCSTTQKLDLRCMVHPEAVPLLAGLPRLRELTIELRPGRGAAKWTTAASVAGPGVLVP